MKNPMVWSNKNKTCSMQADLFSSVVTRRQDGRESLHAGDEKRKSHSAQRPWDILCVTDGQTRGNSLSFNHRHDTGSPHEDLLCVSARPHQVEGTVSQSGMCWYERHRQYWKDRGVFFTCYVLTSKIFLSFCFKKWDVVRGAAHFNHRYKSYKKQTGSEGDNLVLVGGSRLTGSN